MASQVERGAQKTKKLLDAPEVRKFEKIVASKSLPELATWLKRLGPKAKEVVFPRGERAGDPMGMAAEALWVEGVQELLGAGCPPKCAWWILAGP